MTLIPCSVRSILTISALAFAFTSLQARADIISVTYQFTGTCADCTGTGISMLTLQNYTPGAALSSDNFVSFTYSSNMFPSYSIPDGAQLGFIFGNIPASLPAAAFVEIGDNSASPIFFFSSTNGFWCIGQNCGNDNGPASTWSLASSAVPEPFTLIPVGLGLIVVGAIRRKKRS